MMKDNFPLRVAIHGRPLNIVTVAAIHRSSPLGPFSPDVSPELAFGFSRGCAQASQLRKTRSSIATVTPAARYKLAIMVIASLKNR